MTSLAASARLQAGVAADRKEGGDRQRRWSPGDVSAASSRHDQLSCLIQSGVAWPMIVEGGSGPK